MCGCAVPPATFKFSLYLRRPPAARIALQSSYISKLCMMGQSPIIIPTLMKRVASAMPSLVFKGSKPPFVHDWHVTRDGHKKEIREVSFGIVMPSLTCQDVNALISLTREIKVLRDKCVFQVWRVVIEETQLAHFISKLPAQPISLLSR
jgi:hypothetical protein